MASTISMDERAAGTVATMDYFQSEIQIISKQKEDISPLGLDDKWDVSST